ncbi:MAG: restriction endonuclease subunit R [Deltaproteobacteria bacterium]|nr:restriction endonuclease subunit R [Deltaproteobacteria bacterium]
MEKLADFIRKIQSDERFADFDEAAVKQGIVLKILSFLEWDPFDVDEVQPECKAGSSRVDFSLRHENRNKVFLSIKKGSEDFTNHQERLLKDAVDGRVEMAILTDGLRWMLFLPLVDGVRDKRAFHVIDMKGQAAEEISQKFQEFLSKENVASGKALKTAESIYETRKRNTLIEEHLPKAWRNIIREPEKWMADLLADVTYELCGYRPERERVEKFLAEEVEAKTGIRYAVTAKHSPAPSSNLQPERNAWSERRDDLAGKSIIAFTLAGKRYEVKSWKAMFLKFCDVLLPKHRKDELEVLFTVATPHREYFSRNPYEFLTAEKIPGTSVYVDTNLSAGEVIDLSHKLLVLFGRKENDLSLEVT